MKQQNISMVLLRIINNQKNLILKEKNFLKVVKDLLILKMKKIDVHLMLNSHQLDQG